MQTLPKLKMPIWQRIAAFFSFVALISALLAPSAMLAEELRTGKLGGVCQVNTAVDAGSTDTALAAEHCDSCSSLAFVTPAFTSQNLPGLSGQMVIGVPLPFDLAARISGLPPSRGPPSL